MNNLLVSWKLSMIFLGGLMMLPVNVLADLPNLTNVKSYHTGIQNLSVSRAYGDFNGDSCIDAAIGHKSINLNNESGSIRLLLNDCSGTLALGPVVSTGRLNSVGNEDGPVAMLSFDVNQDGFDDLVTAFVDGLISTFVSHGDGTFAPRVDTWAMAGTMDLAGYPRLERLDINGYPFPGIVLWDAYGYATNIGIFMGWPQPIPGSGYFTMVRQLNPGVSRVAVGDLNGNGKSEVVIASTNQVDEVVIVELNADSSITYNTAATSTRFFTLATGDFNGDGALDIAGTGYPLGAVLFNDGAGGFTENLEPMLSYYSLDTPNIAVGDFDRDGVDDIARAGSSDGSSVAELNQGQILLFNAVGQLWEMVNFTACDPVQAAPYFCDRSDFEVYIDAVDFNHDGCLDLALFAEESANATRLMTVTQSCPLSKPQCIPNADANRDGRINIFDLITIKAPGTYNKSVDEALTPTADVDCSGFIDGLDVAYLKNTM